jgi:dihydrofolate reductase
MGKLVVSENICLDGVAEDPVGQDGFERGGWFSLVSPGDYEAWAKVELDEALGADALLLGRRTDHFFAAGWNTREGEWAERLRSLPKYVVSSTLAEAEWINSTVLRGPVVDEVTQLVQRYDREIVVYGSAQLVHTLLEHDLVDEVRLTVHPWVLGTGTGFFAELSERKELRLIGCRGLGDNLVHLAYDVVGPAR